MTLRQLLVTVNAARLLLRGKQGEEVVAELRDWSGPQKRTSGLIALIVLVGVVGLGLSAGRGSVRELEHTFTSQVVHMDSRMHVH